MQNPSFAVIDLGTNTFHLLIIKNKNESIGRQSFNMADYEILHKERIYVKLAEEGIETIANAPFTRAVNALEYFGEIIKKHNVQYIRAFGTAAMRTASNGKLLIQKVKEEIGIQIDLIDGLEEARLIHNGVMQAIEIHQERILIMDIGGGSVEFIIADKDKVYWSQSFPIGVAVLFKEFHKTEPISEKEILDINNYLNEILKPLLRQLEKYPTNILVGASGTFDVLQASLTNISDEHTSVRVKSALFTPFYDIVMNTTYKERLKMPSIPPKRADLIIVALELINFIINKVGIQEIIVSAYAMKEGILKELVQQKLSGE